MFNVVTGKPEYYIWLGSMIVGLWLFKIEELLLEKFRPRVQSEKHNGPSELPHD